MARGAAVESRRVIRLDWKSLRAEAPIIAVLALPVILLGPALLPGKVLSSADILLRSYLFADARPASFQPANDLVGDPVLQFVPWRKLTTTDLRSGRIPSWNPDAFAGSVLHGHSMSAVFDPLCLPYLLTGDDPSCATVWVALLRMWVAGIGAFLLARRLGCSPPGAAIAGMAYGCGGFTVVWLLAPPTSSSAWLPWALLAAEAMVTRRGIRPVVAVAMTLTASMLGGQPEVAFFCAIAASIYAMARRWQLGRGDFKAWRAFTVRLALAGTLTILLTAVQTLPLVEALKEGSILSVRQPHGSILAVPKVAWETLATQVFPYLFGRPLRGEGAILGGVTNFCESNGRYVSLLGLVLALLGAGSLARGRPGRSLAFVTAFAWLYSASVPPVSTIAGIVPVLNLAWARRADFVVLLGLAILAGLGLDALVAQPRQRLARAARLSATLLAGAAIAATLAGVWLRLGAPGYDRAVAAAMKAPLVGGWLIGKTTSEIVADLVRLAPMYATHFVLPWAIFAMVAALWLFGSLALRPHWRRTLAGLAVAADLLYFGWGFNPALPRDQVYPVSAGTKTVTAIAGDGRTLLIDQWLGNPANLGAYFGWRDVLGYDVIGHRRLESLLGMWGPFPPGPGPFPLLHYDRTDPPVLDLLGVRVVTSRQPLDAPNLQLVGRIGEGYCYRNPTALAPAFVPAEVVVVPGADAARHILARPGFRPERTAVVETRDGASRPPARGVVLLERPAPDRIRLLADLETGGTVVISEAYSAGWRATEQGQRLQVYPCDLAVMAIEVGAGHHEIELAYRPPGWDLAVLLSAAGLAASLAALFVRRRGLFQT